MRCSIRTRNKLAYLHFHIPYLTKTHLLATVTTTREHYFTQRLYLPSLKFGLPVPLRNCMYKCFWHRLTWCVSRRFLKFLLLIGSPQTEQLCKCQFPNSLFVANITVFPSATVSGLPCLSPICNLTFWRLR
jgi:hypothetical protein